jgi:chain length determinant protein EpsF
LSLAQLLLILRARWRIALLALLLTVAAALGATLLSHKTYKATTSLVLNYKGSDPVTGQAMASQLLPGYMATQIEIVGSMSVARKVVDALRLAEGELVKQRFLDAGGEGDLRDWVAAGLLSKLEVLPARESSVLQISYVGREPQMTAAVANAFAAAYQQASIALKVEPSQRTSVYFNEQVKLLRDKLETAQQRLSKYQQDNGLVSTDRALDVESVRLNELSSQAVAAQGQAMEAAARRRQVQGRGAAQSPDVANNPLIQNLKMGLNNAESKFAEIAQRLDRNHPQYQSAKAEVDKLRAELNAQVAHTSSAVSANADILQQRGNEAGAVLQAQKNKVLRLNRVRDELSLLGKEVDSAQRAYDTVAQKLTLTNIEAKANQSDVAVLTTALPPLKPFSPKLLLNTLIGLAAGVLLGLGGAVILELFDRRVRSARDLQDTAGLVVLGVIRSAHGARRRAAGQLGFGRGQPTLTFGNTHD